MEEYFLLVGVFILEGLSNFSLNCCIRFSLSYIVMLTYLPTYIHVYIAPVVASALLDLRFPLKK